MMQRLLVTLLACVLALPVYAAWEDDSYFKGAFKRTAGVAHTANANDPPNEGIPTQIIQACNQIMGQAIPGTPPACDPQDAVDLGIVEYIEADLVLVSGSDNKCYEAKFPAAYTGHFGAGAQGDPIRDFTFAIPLSYNTSYAAADHSGGYGPDLYDNAVRIPATSATDWWFDPYSATVTSETNLSLGATGTIRIYLWTGKTIADLLPLHNFDDAAAPTLNDDEDDGYAAGSIWVDVNDPVGDSDVYMCVSAAAGAAVWVALTGSCPTAEEIRQEMDNNSTQLAAIVADTNELQTDWTDGGRLDLLLDDVPTTAEFEARTLATGSYCQCAHAGDPIDVDAGGNVFSNVQKVSNDSTAADNLELDYDGTGYNKSASTIGTATTLTNTTGFSLGATGLDAIEPESGFTLPDMLAVIAAMVAGELSGAGTNTITVKAADGSALRVVMTVDGAGNRSSVEITKP